MNKEEIRSAAKEYVETIDLDFADKGSYSKDDVEIAYENGVLSDTARKHWEPKWISPLEPPDGNYSVLIKFKNKLVSLNNKQQVTVGIYIESDDGMIDGKGWYDETSWSEIDGYKKIDNVTGWMFFPSTD